MTADTNQESRSALITGSSRGIGLAIAEELAQAGYNVCLNCSSEGGLERTQAEAERIQTAYGVQAIALVGNVAQSDQADALVKGAIEAFGRIDVLVNNAGITKDKLIMKMSEADFSDVIDVNLKGTFNCCKAATRPMMKQRFGRMINLSSIVGVYGNAGQANYAASKAGIIGLTKSLAKELASRNITSNAIAPGFIATDMTDALTDDQKAAITTKIGCGRLGEAADVAHLVRFLASEEASYITGQVICIDGGLSL